jgi:hypothetical protein
MNHAAAVPSTRRSLSPLCAAQSSYLETGKATIAGLTEGGEDRLSGDAKINGMLLMLRAEGDDNTAVGAYTAGINAETITDFCMTFDKMVQSFTGGKMCICPVPKAIERDVMQMVKQRIRAMFN